MTDTKVRTSTMLIMMVVLISWSLTTNASAEINWRRSPENVMASARATSKPILVFVTTDWCHYCKKMKRDTWADPTVSHTVSDKFETLVLDGDRDKQMVERLSLKGYPATLVFTSDGHYIAKQDGYMSPSQTLRWLGTVVR